MEVKQESIARSQTDGIDYTQIVQSSEFKQLLQAKKRFIIPMTIFFFTFYFILPIMTSYSKILNTPAIGDITWAWVFGFAQFIMTWTLCILYSKKAQSFDKLSDNILKKIK
jgi:uncharacterized membrane protein (DUF485 family)